MLNVLKTSSNRKTAELHYKYLTDTSTKLINDAAANVHLIHSLGVVHDRVKVVRRSKVEGACFHKVSLLSCTDGVKI